MKVLIVMILLSLLAAGAACGAERLWPLQGAYNFRDLGGKVNRDGRQVVKGKLFRSDGLEALKAQDLALLDRMGLKTVIDFRTREEAANAPDQLPKSVVNYLPCSIEPGALGLGKTIDQLFGPKNEVEFMTSMYRQMIKHKAGTEVYRQFFACLAQEANLPLLFHCSAGKDRTGLAAALFYGALDVDRAVIMADYLASNDYLKGKYQQTSPMYRVQPEFLEAAWDEINQRHGSLDNYLSRVLEVDLPELRRQYLH